MFGVGVGPLCGTPPLQCVVGAVWRRRSETALSLLPVFVHMLISHYPRSFWAGVPLILLHIKDVDVQTYRL